MPRDIEKALRVSLNAHISQVDKAGAPYILHPIAVAARFRYCKNKYIAAILHDVVEDTCVTLEDLKEEGFSYEVIRMVDLLTKRDGESYNDFINRIIDDDKYGAIEIKISDIDDNMSRLENLPQETQERLRNKYSKALAKLKKAKEKLD